MFRWPGAGSICWGSPPPPSPPSSWSSGNLLCPAPSSKTGLLPLPQAQALGSPRVFWKLLPASFPATAQGSFPSSCNDPFVEELGHMGDRNQGRTCFSGQGKVNGAKRGTPAGVLETLLLIRAQSWPILATPWTPAHQAPLSMGFPRQEYWSGLPFPSPGNLPDPGIKPGSPGIWCIGRWILYH